jgi:hypothetical protein
LLISPTASRLRAATWLQGELIDGEPLFAGDSDIDQLYRIQRILGPMVPLQQDLFHRNPHNAGAPARRTLLAAARACLQLRYHMTGSTVILGVQRLVPQYYMRTCNTAIQAYESTR